MPTKIKSSDFSSYVADLIAEFGDEAAEANEKAIRKVAKDVTKELRSAGSYGGSKYRKTIGAEIKTSRIGIEASVGSKTPPGLTHLLEFGHAKKGGGRTKKAFNFIAPINDTVEAKYMKEMEALLK